MIMKYLLILIFIIIIFFITNIFCKKYNNYKNNKLLENFSKDNKYCCIYAYYEKDYIYKGNFIYFLKNGILENVDYYIVINGECTVNIPKKKNIIIYKRENKGYDFGAFSFLIKKLIKKYDFYFFLNTSVRGPYLKDNNKKWIYYFLDLFNKDVKIVGTTINIFRYNYVGGYVLPEIYNKKKPFTHVQSMFFCIDKEYFNYLNKINFFNEDELNNAPNLEYVIAYKEIGLSHFALINNWNINSVLSKYKDMDYRIINKDNTSKNKIDEYEIIFYKNKIKTSKNIIKKS